MRLDQLDSFARRHHGLITRSAAEQLGVDRSAWHRAIAGHQLEQLYPNVARLWGTAPTLSQRALAAVWAAPAGTMASHRTSAALWGIERPQRDPIDVMMPDRTRYTRIRGVVVHRPRDLVDMRPIVRDRVPTTNPLRMLVDLGAVDAPAVAAAMIAVMTTKVASPTAIRAALARHARSGRHGVTALRTALEEWIDDELPPDSELEARMAKLIRRFSLPPMQFHEMVEGYEVDFHVVGTKVILECDGWGTHGLDRDQFEFDRIRNTDLVAAGYVVVHFTWKQLKEHPGAVAERIRRVYERWAS